MNINVIIGNASGVQISEGTVDSRQKQTVPLTEKIDFDVESESATHQIENLGKKEDAIGNLKMLQHKLKKWLVEIVEKLTKTTIAEIF